MHISWSKKHLALLLTPALLIFLSCSSPPSEAKPSAGVTDQLGRTVKLDKIPEKIISLAPANTEILFALGLGEKVVAVTDYDDYPPEARTKPSIGGYSTPSLEQIVACSPDLILADSIQEKTVIPQLESRGIKVFALYPKSLSQVMEAIIMIGKITGKEKEASSLVSNMEKRIKAITDKTGNLSQEQRPRVFYLVWHDPLMAAGSETLHDELISKGGGINIASSLKGYADISLEAVIHSDPEVLIAGVNHGTGEELTFQFLKSEPRLSTTSARKNDRVYSVDGNLTSRGGPRLVEGLEILANYMHPELFK